MCLSLVSVCVLIHELVKSAESADLRAKWISRPVDFPSPEIIDPLFHLLFRTWIRSSRPCLSAPKPLPFSLYLLSLPLLHLFISYARVVLFSCTKDAPVNDAGAKGDLGAE